MLDALAQPAGGGEADGFVGGARIGEVERAQRGAQPRPQRLAPLERGLRQRRKQQRDAEVRVRRRDAARRLHAASTVSPTPRSPARASSGPTAIALRSMSS